MYKVVLDSSILVSAFLSQKGANSLVVQKGKDEYYLYLSKSILDETSDALLTYKRIRKKYISANKRWDTPGNVGAGFIPARLYPNGFSR